MPLQVAVEALTPVIEHVGAGSQSGKTTPTAVPAQAASAASTTFTVIVAPVPAVVTVIGDAAPLAKTVPLPSTTL